MDSQFEELEGDSTAAEVEARLSELKGGGAPATQISPTQVTAAIEASPTESW